MTPEAPTFINHRLRGDRRSKILSPPIHHLLLDFFLIAKGTEVSFATDYFYFLLLSLLSFSISVAKLVELDSLYRGREGKRRRLPSSSTFLMVEPSRVS